MVVKNIVFLEIITTYKYNYVFFIIFLEILNWPKNNFVTQNIMN